MCIEIIQWAPFIRRNLGPVQSESYKQLNYISVLLAVPNVYNFIEIHNIFFGNYEIEVNIHT